MLHGSQIFVRGSHFKNPVFVSKFLGYPGSHFPELLNPTIVPNRQRGLQVLKLL